MSDPYAIDAQYYDLVHGRGGPDVDFWLAWAESVGGPLLEVGCGTGRIALALAGAGHAVTGLDPSPAMLAIARRQAEAAGLGVSLVEGLARGGTLPDAAYDGVIVPADVFLYCEHVDAQIETLQALARGLDRGGSLAIDLPGPALGLDPSRNGEPVLVFAGEGPDGEQLHVWHVTEDDPAEQTRLLRVLYDRTGHDGTLRREASVHRLRYVTRFELVHLLARTGFAVRATYGDYELGPLTAESERMIVVATKEGP